MTGSDNLIKYTGISIPELGITNGMSLDSLYSEEDYNEQVQINE